MTFARPLHKTTKYAGKHATHKVAKQSNGYSPTKAFYFGLRKVHSRNVKYRFATTHDYGGTVANVAIYTVGLVNVRQNCQTATAGKWQCAFSH